MNSKRTTFFASLIVLMLIAAACAQQPAPVPAPPDLRAESERAIRAEAEAWSATLPAGDVEKFLSYYAPDAAMYPPGAPKATTTEARREIAKALMAPGNSASTKVLTVEASRSGDIGFETGTYEVKSKVKGKEVVETGKYVVVWKKQADGKWKAFADIFNADK